MDMGTVTNRLAVVVGVVFLLGAAAAFLVPSGAGGYDCGNPMAPAYPEDETEAVIEDASDTVGDLDPGVFGQMRGGLAGSTMALAAAYGTCSDSLATRARLGLALLGAAVVVPVSIAFVGRGRRATSV